MDNNIKKETVTVSDRRCFTMNGVINIEGFDEDYVALSTADGNVSIEGSELKIESLLKDSGEILITGNIGAVVFHTDKKQKKGKRLGIFK